MIVIQIYIKEICKQQNLEVSGLVLLPVGRSNQLIEDLFELAT